MLSKIMDKFLALFLTPRLGGFVRHLLSYLGGILTLVVGLSPEVVEQWQLATEPVLIGVAFFGLAWAMSFIEKLRGTRK